MRRVTLLTDFGTADGYAGAMKGVVAAIAPNAWIEDMAHDIAPGDLAAAAWALQGYAFLFPPDTVHVVVVDPGVGTSRLPIAARVRDRFFVLPDNGILDAVTGEADPEAVVRLENLPQGPQSHSTTFHGRDIFAPAAGHLASGGGLRSLGSPVATLVRLDVARPLRTADGARGQVRHVDRFGNLISDIPAAWAEGGEVFLAGESIGPLLATYGAVQPQELLALIGSRQTVEIAVRNGSAAERLGANRGTPVSVRRRGLESSGG